METISQRESKALLDLTFYKGFCCVGPVFGSLSNIQTTFACCLYGVFELFLLGLQRLANFLKC